MLMDIDTHIHIDTSNIYSRKKTGHELEKIHGSVGEGLESEKGRGMCNYNYAHDTHD